MPGGVCRPLLRWPGVIKPGTVSNEICAHEDMLPTILAAAGVPDIKEQLLQGCKVGDVTHKVHLDGYNLVPYLKGEVTESPRKEMLYWSNDGDLMALRYGNWKAVFKEQRAESFQVWSEPMVDLRVPKIFNLRERSVREGGPQLDLLQQLAGAPGIPSWCRRRVSWRGGFRASRNFRQARSLPSFSVDQVMEKLTAAGQKNH